MLCWFQYISYCYIVKVDSVDTKLLQQLAYTAAGLLPPLATTLGGVLAQECLIAVTGKFSPLKQWVLVLLECHLR